MSQAKRARPQRRSRGGATQALTISILSPSAEDRLNWMMEFCGLDLQKCSASGRRELERDIGALAMRWGDRRGSGAGDLEAAQETLRAFLVDMAHHQSFSRAVPEAEWTFLQVEDDRRMPKSGKPPKSGARWPSKISRSYRVPVPIALVLHAADMLDVVGADRLMACPFPGDQKSGPCPKIFLATRRQRYCSEEHSKKAAWLAWLQRQGGTRAK